MNSEVDLYVKFSKMLFIGLFLPPETMYHGRTGLNMKANANDLAHVDICGDLTASIFTFKRQNVER